MRYLFCSHIPLYICDVLEIELISLSHLVIWEIALSISLSVCLSIISSIYDFFYKWEVLLGKGEREGSGERRGRETRVSFIFNTK